MLVTDTVPEGFEKFELSKGISGDCPFFKKHRPVRIHDETK